ncbi:hypothetical protein QE406_001953 [Microbacterium testaceum]|nr:hypothetical protein [Microbacterium sp. SORGH_AS_0969]MDQ1115944.1 hypothetical protein [Microbacterium testaceum]
MSAHHCLRRACRARSSSSADSYGSKESTVGVTIGTVCRRCSPRLTSTPDIPAKVGCRSMRRGGCRRRSPRVATPETHSPRHRDCTSRPRRGVALLQAPSPPSGRRRSPEVEVSGAVPSGGSAQQVRSHRRTANRRSSPTWPGTRASHERVGKIGRSAQRSSVAVGAICKRAAPRGGGSWLSMGTHCSSAQKYMYGNRSSSFFAAAKGVPDRPTKYWGCRRSSARLVTSCPPDLRSCASWKLHSVPSVATMV